MVFDDSILPLAELFFFPPVCRNSRALRRMSGSTRVMRGDVSGVGRPIAVGYTVRLPILRRKYL